MISPKPDTLSQNDTYLSQIITCEGRNTESIGIDQSNRTQRRRNSRATRDSTFASHLLHHVARPLAEPVAISAESKDQQVNMHSKIGNKNAGRVGKGSAAGSE